MVFKKSQSIKFLQPTMESFETIVGPATEVHGRIVANESLRIDGRVIGNIESRQGKNVSIALGRTGKDVGTPILTFNPKAVNEASLFGPVISKIPRGDEATKLWDAVQTIAESGVAEIKRSLRAAPQFD